jgi:hypothetical protein
MRVARDLLAVTAVVVALNTPATAGATGGDDGGSGDQPVRHNCPAGFVWIRMSGTGCVQEHPLPPHGKIGYDGHALCIEPYVGIYEQRPTTDGEPAPGTPYNSFAYLLSCVAREDYDRAVAELAEEGGGRWSRRTVAGISVVGGAVVLGGAAVLAGRRRTRSGSDAAATKRDARTAAIRTRLDSLAKQRAHLDAKTERIRKFLNSGEWTLRDLNEITGLLSSLVGAGLSVKEFGDSLKLSATAAKTLSDWFGFSSSVATTGGLTPGRELGVDEAREELWKSLENIGLLQGVIDGEHAALEAELAALEQPDEADRLPAESYSDYDAIQGRIDGINDEIGDLQQRRNGHATKQLELQRDLDGIQHSTNELRNLSIDFEQRQDIVSGWGKTAAALALVAGIAAFGPAAGALATVVGTGSSVASFSAWWYGASADDRREAIALGLQGTARMRGSVLHQIEHAAAQEATATKDIEAAVQYKGRLRQHQAKLAPETGRPTLWSDG